MNTECNDSEELFSLSSLVSSVSSVRSGNGTAHKNQLTSNSSSLNQPQEDKQRQEEMVNSQCLITLKNIKQEPEDDYPDNCQTTTSNFEHGFTQSTEESASNSEDSSCVICLQCNKWFDCVNDLKKHNEIKHRREKANHKSTPELASGTTEGVPRRVSNPCLFLCKECNLWFFVRMDLEVHNQSMHLMKIRQEQAFKVETIGARFIQVQNIKKKQPKEDCDSQCKDPITSIVVTAGESSQTAETSSGHIKKIELFLCKQCNRWFSRRTGLQKHQRIAHGKGSCVEKQQEHLCEQQERQQQKQQQQVITNELQQECDQQEQLCEQQEQQQLEKQQQVINDLQEEHDQQEPLCEQQEQQNQQQQVITSKLQEVHEQQDLPYSKEQPQIDNCSNGQEHANVDATSSSSGNPQDIASILSLCTVCSIWYTTRKELHEHQETKHKSETRSSSKPTTENDEPETNRLNITCASANNHNEIQNLKIVFKCEICELCFTNSHDLDCHFKRHVEMPYKCEHCKTGFAEKTFLENHLDCECSYRPFACNVCKRKFDCEKTLENHGQSHDDGNAKELFKCGRCLKGFPSISILKVHLESHLADTTKSCALKCQICHQELGNIENLYKHFSQMHTKGKYNGYECSICFEMLSTKALLMEHSRVKHNSQRYKCSVCSETYKTKIQLKRHFVRHTNGKPQCPICNKAYNHTSTLQNHAMVHTGEMQNKCTVCGESFKYKISLTRHGYRHTGEKPFKCTVCDKAFIHKNSLEAHGHTHTGGKPHKCSFCGKSFFHKISLQRHVDMHIGNKPQKPYKCSHCNEAFKYKVSLESHLNKHAGVEPYQCTVCSRTFTHQKTFKNHCNSHNVEKRFKCKVCGRSFKEESNLNIHSLLHTANSLQCTFCNETFKHRQSLRSHLCLHTKPFKCEICSETFAHKLSLTSHSYKHSGEKPHKCTICSKAFVTKNSLRDHLKTHDQERYHCTLCDEKFPRRALLNKHQVVHTGKIEYKCPICNKIFSENSNFKRHMIVHSGVRPFKCSVCKQQYKEKKDLKKHCLKMHMKCNNMISVKKGEHTCPVCSKVFATNDIMKRHYRVHSGIKNFKCTVCGKEYWWKCNLKKHCLKIHEIWGEEFIVKQQSNFVMAEITADQQMPTQSGDTLGVRNEMILNNQVPDRSKSPLNSDSNKVLQVTSERHKKTVNSDSSRVIEVTRDRRKTPLNSDTTQVPEITAEKEKPNKAGPFESKFCKGCKTWFGRQSKFENHSHKNERRFKCQDCERMFVHSNAFKMHQQTHVK